MFFVEVGVLHLKVLKLFVLGSIVASEQIVQVLHSFADFFVQFLERGLRLFFQLFDFELKFSLLFSLGFEDSFVMIHVALDERIGTSIEST